MRRRQHAARRRHPRQPRRPARRCRRAAPTSRALGTVSETITSTANGRAIDDSGNTVFLDIYAVDDNYPLARPRVRARSCTAGEKPTDLLVEKDGVYGAIVDPVILDRLNIDLGGRFTVNGTEFEVRGLLNSIPDGALRGVPSRA